MTTHRPDFFWPNDPLLTESATINTQLQGFFWIFSWNDFFVPYGRVSVYYDEVVAPPRTAPQHLIFSFKSDMIRQFTAKLLQLRKVRKNRWHWIISWIHDRLQDTITIVNLCRFFKCKYYWPRLYQKLPMRMGFQIAPLLGPYWYSQVCGKLWYLAVTTDFLGFCNLFGYQFILDSRQSKAGTLKIC